MITPDLGVPRYQQYASSSTAEIDMAGALHTDEYRSVVKGLVAARKQAGLSQAALAARLERPPSYVAKVELCERRLDVIEFCRIAEELSLDPFDFLRENMGRATSSKASREQSSAPPSQDK